MVDGGIYFYVGIKILRWDVRPGAVKGGEYLWVMSILTIVIVYCREEIYYFCEWELMHDMSIIVYVPCLVAE